MIKNRQKGKPRFTNINFIGKCNAKCYFCIGNEVQNIDNSYFNKHFLDFPNLEGFLEDLKKAKIKKIYLTGLNAEPSIYPYLNEFVEYLKIKGFKVGIRTNGLYPIDYKMFNDEVSISIHSYNNTINKLIGIGTIDIDNLISRLEGINHRYCILVNRYNKDNIIDLISKLSKDKGVKYIQLRQVCTDNEDEKYLEDLIAFKYIEEYMENHYKCIKKFDGCLIYKVNNKQVSIWKPMTNDTNSWNYFIDGKITKNYFVVEGYNNEN